MIEVTKLENTMKLNEFITKPWHTPQICAVVCEALRLELNVEVKRFGTKEFIKVKRAGTYCGNFYGQTVEETGREVTWHSADEFKVDGVILLRDEKDSRTLDRATEGAEL
jgi:hypothetical protein